MKFDIIEIDVYKEIFMHKIREAHFDSGLWVDIFLCSKRTAPIARDPAEYSRRQWSSGSAAGS